MKNQESQDSNFGRHYSALMRKNYINWKRTPCSSFMEIGLTIILCLMLIYKWATSTYWPDDWSNFHNDNTRPYYPAWTLDNKTGNWTNAYAYSAEQSVDYKSFMKWGNWSEGVVTDPFSPYWWNPNVLCYPDIDRTNYNPSLQPWSMPIIAYVKSDNQIQRDLVEQLELQFQNQLNARAFLKEFFTNGMAHDLHISRFDLLNLFGWTHTNVTNFNSTSYMNFANFTLQEFESHDAIDTYVKSDTYATKDQPGICFGFSFEETAHNKYELNLMFSDREPILQIPNASKTKFFSQNQFKPNGGAQMQWWATGFTMMQNWVANTILKRKSGVSNANILNMVVPFPNANTEGNSYENDISVTFFMYLIMFWLPLLYRTTYRIVQEKQSKAQEVMRMMGMTNIPYWLSWWTYFSVISLSVSLVAWLLLQFTIFKSSEPTILLLLFVLFGQSLFGVIMVTQSLSNDCRIASICCSCLYFGMAQMALALSGETLIWLKITLMCLNPSLSLSLGINTYIKFGFTPSGLHFSSWTIPIRGVSVQMAIITTAVSTVFWIVLGIYLEIAIPKTYGSKRGYCFCITECFSCCRRKKTIQSAKIDFTDPDFDTKYLSKTCFEPVSKLVAMKELERQILKVSDLEKSYDNGTKAVNGVNLKLYQDQIFILLGHNGAGKTTTISMLSGLFEPTHGNATVFGKNLCGGDNYSARRMMGVCPQYDVLFDLLTPEEHLDFFYEMKGAPVDIQKKQEEIQKLMIDVGVDDKKDAMSMTLSGGNKRKLSVAIALVGGSKFLIFDEPTAGMDLNARRHLWNMFKKYKAGRIILMSTHYMDEADILGDRIGIMCAGKMTCLGSSIFLKKKFGIGYNMVVVKDSAQPNTVLLPYLHRNLGVKTQMTSEIQNEITIKIPEIYSSKFTDFFADFDTKLASLKIRNYGISISSLEEVFMKIGSLTDLSNLDQSDAPKKNRNYSDSDPEIIGDHKMSGGKGVQDTINNVPIKQIQKMKQSPSSSELDLTYQKISDYDLETDSNWDSKSDLDQELLPKSELPTKIEISSNFSIKQNFNDLDTSFCSNTNAILYKKLSVYRRNKMGFFYEICVPMFVVCAGITIGTVIDDSRGTSPTVMDAHLMLPKTKILFNPQMVDTLRSNLPTSVFANNMKTDGNMNVTYNANWTTYSRTSVYTALNYSFDWGHNESYVPPWHSGDYIWYAANKTSQEYKFYTFINATQTGPAPVFSQIMYESTLRVALDDPELEFTTVSKTLPKTHFAYYRHQWIVVMTISFTLAISISMMMAQTVSAVVSERVSGLKHLQILSGMQKASYWVANFIFDFVKFQTVMSLTCLAMWIINVNIKVTYIVYLTVSFAIVPFVYATSFLFSSESVAQIITMFLNFFVISILQQNVYTARTKPDAATELEGDINNWIYRIWPTYVLSDSLKVESAHKLINLVRVVKIDMDPWNINNQLGCIIANGVNACIWILVLIVIESCHCKRKPEAPLSQSSVSKQQKVTLDEDVIAENIRVADGCDQEIIVQGFSKEFSKVNVGFCSFSKFQAVNNLSFALGIGECFALLGVNGAGKTTTFKSLTNEVMPTVGRFSLGGFDLFTDFDQARKLIGYSPQHNLVFETMNVDEHIQYYARLKGIPVQFRDQIVEETIIRLGLLSQRYEAVGSLSGGNQRKVCAAVALVGNPPIILLDEPSAGMDPKARRFMWEVVAKITQRQQSAIVLTTHSMEEAEALSTKMAIMVKGGVFKCFGSSQHIRNKFGTGYVIEIKIRTVHEDEFAQLWGEYFQESGDKPVLSQSVISLLGTYFLQELHEEMKAFSDLQLLRFVHGYINIYRFVADICQYFGNNVEKIEVFGNSAKFKVQKSEKSIGFVFGLIERLRVKHEISEYSVSQTTLEQIFQIFADLDFSDSIVKFSIRDGQLQVQQ